MRQGREGRHKRLCPQASYPHEQMGLNPTMEENLGACEEHTPQNFATQGEGTRVCRHQLPSVLGWRLLWGSMWGLTPAIQACWAHGQISSTAAKALSEWDCSANRVQLTYNDVVRLERVGWALTAAATIGEWQIGPSGKSTDGTQGSQRVKTRPTAYPWGCCESQIQVDTHFTKHKV